MSPAALVGAVPSSYARATRTVDLGPIDVALARLQHARYVEALDALGYTIHRVEADDGNPDCVFVEDQAVVVDGRALVTRSGHPGRRAEADLVAAALRDLGLDVVRMPETATLDGGDVLRTGAVLWVGASSRTDPAGAAVLADVFPALEVRTVVLPPGVLHLKCVVTSPVPGVVLAAEGAVDVPWADYVARVIRVPAVESWAANVVGRGRRVIVGDGFPATAEALRGAGFEVLPVEVSEIRKGDGSLTCLSIQC